MSDPAYPAWQAVKARLTAAGIKAYDEIPPGKSYPYVTLGPTQTLPDMEDSDSDCTQGSELFMQLDGWTEKPALEGAAALARAVRTALRAYLTITGHTVVVQDPVETRLEKEPRTELAHAVMSLRLLTEPTA